MKHDLQLIDRKLSHELTETEEQVFVQRLARDEDFARQYAFALAAIEALQEQPLRDEIRSWTTQSETISPEVRPSKAITPFPPKKQLPPHWYAIAATVLLLIGLGVWYLNSQSATPESLYETYYTVYPADPVLRGEPTADYSQAMQYYREGQYAQAIPLFEALYQADSTDEWVALFLGNSYLNTDEPEQATRYFEQVAASEDMIVRQYGQWYLALSYLKSNHLDQARVLLTPLSEKPGIFQKKAQAMLRELS